MTYTVVSVYTDNGQVHVGHVEAPDPQTAATRAKRDAEAAIFVLSIFEGKHQDVYSENELMEGWV